MKIFSFPFPPPPFVCRTVPTPGCIDPLFFPFSPLRKRHAESSVQRTPPSPFPFFFFSLLLCAPSSKFMFVFFSFYDIEGRVLSSTAPDRSLPTPLPLPPPEEDFCQHHSSFSEPPLSTPLDMSTAQTLFRPLATHIRPFFPPPPPETPPRITLRFRLQQILDTGRAHPPFPWSHL